VAGSDGQAPLKARVLIVDDEADIRELLTLTLNRMGLSTDSADSEFEARRLLQKQQYDVCLTDMRLPDGDGLALLEASRQEPALPGPKSANTSYAATAWSITAVLNSST
jgi:two-component system response regulator PilR (NtrC family)